MEDDDDWVGIGMAGVGVEVVDVGDVLCILEGPANDDKDDDDDDGTW